MELEGSRLAVGCGNGKLRQWLIDQIDSRIYSGLVWENEQKSVFRIPWKHAGKQDYNRDEDAALFKAWALFKGKFKEGVDKPDPPTWKTRLRCALNKSNDFDELVERSQLDISEPYKVYRIIPEGAKKGVRLDSLEDTRPHGNAMGYIPSYSFVQNQVSSYMLSQDRKDWMDQQPLGLPSLHHGRHAEQQFVQGHDPSPLSRPHWTTPHPENVGFQVSGSFYSCSTESQAAAFTVDHSGATSDFSLHVSLFYRESLVKEVTTTSPKGCRITSCSPSSPPSSSSSSSSSSTSPSPSPEERLCAGAEVILFPFPYPESQRRGAEKLPDVLERGVLLWMAPDGLYATRLCQGRVYWEGPLAPHQDRPNKLEKDQTCKLFDTQQFLSELQEFAHYGCRLPRHEVVLCFGDEYPNPQRQRKMITAQVEPVFAKKLLCHYKGYDPIQQDAGMALHFPNQRSLQHIQ